MIYKKLLRFFVMFVTVYLLCSCGVPPATDITIVSLDADLLTGELPQEMSSVIDDHASAPCLLVGSFETDESLAIWTQTNPEMEPSYIGSLTTELQLPPASADEEVKIPYGVITTLSTTGQQIVSAFFPLTQLAPIEPVNQLWSEGDEGEYLIPVIVSTEGKEYYLRSLMTGSFIFRTEAPLPPELSAKAIDTADIGPEVCLSHCGIAKFSILSKMEDGSYLIELKGFLSL